MAIDPNTIPEYDVVRFNLFAPDVGLEFEQTIVGLYECLTRNGIDCGPRRTTYEDAAHLVKFEVEATVDGETYCSTSLLISRGNCYSYSFYANDNWRSCSDCPYELMGAEKVKFSSSYIGKSLKKFGPGSIFNSLYSLTSDKKRSWNNAFHHLCFLFIESARLVPIYDFIRETLVTGAESGALYTHMEKMNAYLHFHVHEWGKISTELQRYYLANPPNRWKLPTVVANALNLSVINWDEEDHDKLVAAILKQVGECVAKVRIVNLVNIGLLNA